MTRTLLFVLLFILTACADTSQHFTPIEEPQPALPKTVTANFLYDRANIGSSPSTTYSDLASLNWDKGSSLIMNHNSATIQVLQGTIVNSKYVRVRIIINSSQNQVRITDSIKVAYTVISDTTIAI